MVHSCWGIVVTCGKSEQISAATDVAFLNLGNNPVLYYTLDAFERCPEIEGVVVVARKEKLETVASLVRLFGCTKVKKVVAGTSQRVSTIAKAMKALDDDVTMVTIHDASRACIQMDLVLETVKAAKRYGSGVAAVKVEEAVLEASKGQKASKVMDRSKLWKTLTPQTFKRELLQKAVDELIKKKLPLDDEASAVCNMNTEVHLVQSSSSNMKIEGIDDLTIAGSLLKLQ